MDAHLSVYRQGLRYGTVNSRGSSKKWTTPQENKVSHLLTDSAMQVISDSTELHILCCLGENCEDVVQLGHKMCFMMAESLPAGGAATGSAVFCVFLYNYA